MQMHFAAAPFLFGNGEWEMGAGGFVRHLC